MELINFLQTGLLNLLPQPANMFLMFYFVCKATDFLTGLLKTWKNPGTYKSRVMRDGIIRWVTEMVAIVFVIILDIVMGLNFILITSTLALFIYKECGSIYENFKACGVTLPNEFTNIIDKINPDKKEDKK